MHGHQANGSSDNLLEELTLIHAKEILFMVYIYIYISDIAVCVLLAVSMA